MTINIKNSMGMTQTVASENCRSLSRIFNMLCFDSERTAEKMVFTFLSEDLAEEAFGVISKCLADGIRHLEIDEFNAHRHYESGDEYYDVPAHLEFMTSSADQILFF